MCVSRVCSVFDLPSRYCACSIFVSVRDVIGDSVVWEESAMGHHSMLGS